MIYRLIFSSNGHFGKRFFLHFNYYLSEWRLIQFVDFLMAIISRNPQHIQTEVHLPELRCPFHATFSFWWLLLFFAPCICRIKWKTTNSIWNWRRKCTYILINRCSSSIQYILKSNVSAICCYLRNIWHSMWKCFGLLLPFFAHLVQLQLGLFGERISLLWDGCAALCSVLYGMELNEMVSHWHWALYSASTLFSLGNNDLNRF